MKGTIKLILSFIFMIISIIILLIIYIILVDVILYYIILIDTILDNITNNNYNCNYNIMNSEGYVLNNESNKDEENPNLFYSKVIEYTRKITVNMFGYIKNQKKYSPNNFMTVLDIVAQQSNFNMTSYNIRESIVNQRNFKIGLSNSSRIFKNCNEHETEVFTFIYDKKKEFQNLYNILETLKKDPNSIFSKSMNFISQSDGHYFMNIQGQKFVFTDSLHNINVIENIYGNNYVTYPYISLDGNLGQQIVIPEIKDNESILNTKYRIK